MSPEYVQPYVKAQKNDERDAEAIAEAASHAKLATVLRGFNQAYNARRQRVLDGLSPEMILQQRLSARPALANPRYKPPKAGAMEAALHIIPDAKEVSQQDD